MQRARSWGSGVTYTLRLVAVAYLTGAGSLLFWSHAPVVVGWQPRVVISGSMMPKIRVGDVALVARATPGRKTLPPNRIVLVRDPSRSTGYYLHRVIRYDDAGNIVTKGDANPVEDYPAVQPGQVAGQMRLLVPYVGLPMIWWQQHLWFRLAVLAGVSWSSLILALGNRRGGDRPTSSGRHKNVESPVIEDAEEPASPEVPVTSTTSA